MPGGELNQNNSDHMWRFCDITRRNRPVLSLHLHHTLADRTRLAASRTGSDDKAAPASNDQGARTGGAPHQELLAEPLPFAWAVSSREFVPHHRDEGVSATCSALSHCLLPLCCAARTPRTPHAALALLPLVPRTRRRTTGTRHHARTTTHDDEKMLRAHTGTKPKTPIDWFARQRGPLRARVASFSLPCERGLNSHTVVITRPRLSLAL